MHKKQQVESSPNTLSIENYFPTEHWSKQIFISEKISVATVANYLGVGYHYAAQILSGTVKATLKNEQKLKELVAHIERRAENE